MLGVITIIKNIYIYIYEQCLCLYAKIVNVFPCAFLHFQNFTRVFIIRKVF